jgi:TolB-like protein
MRTHTITLVCLGLIAALCAVPLGAGCGGHTGSSTVTRAPDEGTTVTSSSGDKLDKVVIKNFSVSGLSEDNAAGVESKFCVDVSKSRKIELICAEDLRNLFKHQSDLIQFGACNEEDCLAKMGQQLEADFIIQASINRVGEMFVFNVNLVEGKTGKVKTRFSREVPSGKPEDLLGAGSAIAEKLILEF